MCISFSAPRFKSRRDKGKVTDNIVREASGLAASRRHRNVLYTINDSGHDPKIIVLDADDGDVKAIYDVEGARNKDWEDIACKNKNQIQI